MVINVEVKDSNGLDLNIGDVVSVFDWCRGEQKLLYVGVVGFDTDDMSLTIQPKDGYVDIDQNDLWHKAGKVKVVSNE